METPSAECRFIERVKERNKVGVWGFGNVSRDVVLSLVDQGLGEEIVFYGRPKDRYPNRAGAWVEDLKANSTRRPRILGTNNAEDMAGLDVIFVGVGVPRREGQSRRDLLAVNTEAIARTSLEIRKLYGGCSSGDLPILVYTGEPEVQPVIAILEKEYGLLKESDGIDSMSFGVPAKIGPYGVEKIYELPVDDVRDELERSASLIKEDLLASSRILREKFDIP
jgi:malate/lactate dehydrogenase